MIRKAKVEELIDARIKSFEAAFEEKIAALKDERRVLRPSVMDYIEGVEKVLNDRFSKFETNANEKLEAIRKSNNERIERGNVDARAHHKLIEGWLEEIKNHMLKDVKP